MFDHRAEIDTASTGRAIRLGVTAATEFEVREALAKVADGIGAMTFTGGREAMELMLRLGAAVLAADSGQTIAYEQADRWRIVEVNSVRASVAPWADVVLAAQQ